MSNLTARMKRRLKRKMSGEKPTAWIGKNGVSQELLKEIEKQLDKKKLVKIRILKSGLETSEPKQVASKTAHETDALLLEVRGHTFTLYKVDKK